MELFPESCPDRKIPNKGSLVLFVGEGGADLVASGRMARVDGGGGCGGVPVEGEVGCVGCCIFITIAGRKNGFAVVVVLGAAADVGGGVVTTGSEAFFASSKSGI